MSIVMLIPSAGTGTPLFVPSRSPLVAMASPVFESRAVTSTGPSNAAPAIMAFAAESSKASGNLGLSIRWTARVAPSFLAMT